MRVYIEWRPWHLPVFGTWLAGVSIGALAAWRHDHLQWFLEGLGLALFGTSFAMSAAMTVFAIAFRVPTRRDRPGFDHSAAEDGGSDGPAAVRLVNVARCWSRDPGASILEDFLSAFDDSLSALQLRLRSMMGEEIGRGLLLHEQIESAEALGIWSSSDLEGWRASLRIRTLILTEGAVGEPPRRLEHRAVWLQDLVHRTDAPVRRLGEETKAAD